MGEQQSAGIVMTPMMRQYFEIKSAHPDAILFFRLGDFYEMFLEDAIVASRILDITLTSRNKGAADEVPLCGIPYHSCQPYIAKLVQHGHRVAICEQVEDPKAAKGIVRREVIRVVTPGLVIDTDTLDPRRNNYLAALAPGGAGRWGLACVDITTGEFRATESAALAEIATELAARDPAEVLIPEGAEGDTLLDQLAITLQGRSINRSPSWVMAEDRAAHELLAAFPHGSLEAFGCQGLAGALGAAGAVLHYLAETQKGRCRTCNRCAPFRPTSSWCWTILPGAIWS